MERIYMTRCKIFATDQLKIVILVDTALDVN